VETIGGVGRAFTWSYDALYRLTDEVISGAAPVGTISYRYDAVGNRTNRTSTVSGMPNQTFAYTANDWLASDVYDANGSTRTNGANVFFYDVENWLTNATVGGVSVSYTYNANGIRVSKTTGGVTTLYLVDDRNPTGYAQVLEELTVSGGVTNLAKVFTYGHDLIAQRIVSSGQRSFYGYDGNGNTRFLTGTNAVISDTYVYDAYGTLLASTGSTANDYLYSGEQNDPTLGLVYLRARYLNTGTGRFWTRDPHPGNNQDPISLHRYLYAHHDPVNRIDPSGHETLAGQISVGGIWGGWAGIQLPAISAAKIRILSIATAATLTLSGDRVHGDFVYRRLSNRETVTPYRQVGLFATDPTAYWVTPDMHIGDDESYRHSPWISTSRDFMVPAKTYVNEFNIQNPIVKIDLRRITGMYLDFTNPAVFATLQTDRARANAIRDSEVLIYAFVPPFAIVASYDGRRLLE
jgi:RHS repeat-associated protein